MAARSMHGFGFPIFRHLTLKQCKKNTTAIYQITQSRCMHHPSTVVGRCKLFISRTAGSHENLLGSNALGTCTVQQQISHRYKSTESTEFIIPEAPPLPALQPEALPDVSHLLNEIGEPTFASLGLCNYTPAGAVQKALELLHVDCGLPWFAAIIAGTIVLRSLLIPVIIMQQRNSAKAYNYMPLFTAAQQKYQRAKATKDQLLYYEAVREIERLRDDKKFSPTSVLKGPMIQAPIFMSVFVGLRGMSNLPVESMNTGGFLWLMDLTIPDPYFVLPIITATTLLITIEVGADTQSTNSMSTNMRYAVRAMPLIMLPIISNMPAALCVYWATANIFSLMVVLTLKIPGLKAYFGIEKMVKHPEALKPKGEGFIKEMKKSMRKAKAEKELQMRRRIDADNFKKAGAGPIPKTYSYNPKSANTANSSDTKESQKL